MPGAGQFVVAAEQNQMTVSAEQPQYVDGMTNVTNVFPNGAGPVFGTVSEGQR